jgi:hypothetical protein
MASRFGFNPAGCQAGASTSIESNVGDAVTFSEQPLLSGDIVRDWVWRAMALVKEIASR